MFLLVFGESVNHRKWTVLNDTNSLMIIFSMELWLTTEVAQTNAYRCFVENEICIDCVDGQVSLG